MDLVGVELGDSPVLGDPGCLAGTLVTHSQVTPVAAPVVPSGTEVKVKDPVSGEVGRGVVTVAKEAQAQ